MSTLGDPDDVPVCRLRGFKVRADVVFPLAHGPAHNKLLEHAEKELLLIIVLIEQLRFMRKRRQRAIATSSNDELATATATSAYKPQKTHSNMLCVRVDQDIP